MLLFPYAKKRNNFWCHHFLPWKASPASYAESRTDSDDTQLTDYVHGNQDLTINHALVAVCLSFL